MACGFNVTVSSGRVPMKCSPEFNDTLMRMRFAASLDRVFLNYVSTRG